MCIPGAATAAIGVASTVGSGIMNARTESKNFKYKTQIAINNAKNAGAEAQRQQQLGIEEARKEKIEGLRQASVQAAKNASNGFDMTSATLGQNYQDIVDNADTNSQSAKDQYNLKADNYFDEAKTYLGQIGAYKKEYRGTTRNNAVNSLMSVGSVADKWYGDNKEAAPSFLGGWVK